MLTFFRNIRRSLIKSNSVRKYLLYSFGEIFLVMIGILLALQVNNWNQNRIERNTEKKLLIELLGNLEENEKRISSSIEDEYKSARSCEIVVYALENQQPYHDSLAYHFGLADFGADLVLTNTAFEAIKSRGFEIISSDQIRQMIIELFDSDYGYLLFSTTRLEDMFWPNRSLPLFHKHFRIVSMKPKDDQVDNRARPINYQALLADNEYINVIKHRGHFRYSGAVLKEQVLFKTQSLKEELRAYLSMF